MDIYHFLDQHEIQYERHDHPAVFTCEDVNRLVPDLPGRKTKNLFICDNKGKQHFLVTVGDDKSVDLKSFAPLLGVKKIRFASEKRLEKYLKLEAGSVTLLGAANDVDHDVTVVVDKAMWESDALQCHPLVNTATLVISMDHIKKFFNATGHDPMVLDVPKRVVS